MGSCVFGSSIFYELNLFSIGLKFSQPIFLTFLLYLRFDSFCLLLSIFIESSLTKKKATHNTIWFIFCLYIYRCVCVLERTLLCTFNWISFHSNVATSERKKIEIKKKARVVLSMKLVEFCRKTEIIIIFLWKLWLSTVKHCKTTTTVKWTNQLPTHLKYRREKREREKKLKITQCGAVELL